MPEDSRSNQALRLMLAEFSASNDVFKKAFAKWQLAIERNAAHKTVVLLHQKVKKAADRYNSIAVVITGLAILVDDDKLRTQVVEVFDRAIAEDVRDYPIERS